MARRKLLSFSVFVFAIGVALVMVGSPFRTSMISPGRLISQHDAVAHACADCHVAGNGRLSDWVHAAFDKQTGPQQDSQCLRCHEDQREHGLRPHGLPPETLGKITQETLRRKRQGKSRDDSAPSFLVWAAKVEFGSPLERADQLSCATCHREHQGRGFELTQMSNDQCQVCHAEAFHSFGEGHPELSHYPYQRRTRIYFDHLSHYGKHFQDLAKPESTNQPKEPVSCRECHEPDGAGRTMLVKGFDHSCANCHADQIESGLSPELVFAAIPGLDTQTLGDNAIDVGNWPTLYPVHVEVGREVGPLMEMLLAAHSDYGEIASRLEDVDLADLRQATPEQLADVGELAWAFKETLNEVIRGGQTKIQQRLRPALGPHVSDALLSDFVKRIPITMLAEAQRRWLPNLAEELAARNKGESPAVVEESKTANAAELIVQERRRDSLVTSGWRLRESDLSLSYRPTGHADQLLKALHDVSAALLHTKDTAFNDTALADSPPSERSQSFPGLHAGLSPFAAGRCVKCHTIDAGGNGVQINWSSRKPSAAARSFTQFTHSPHMDFRNNQSCMRCHTFKTPKTENSTIYHSQFIDSTWSPCTNPNLFESDFAALSKTTCAQCHNDSAAGNSCLTCHNYHIHGH